MRLVIHYYNSVQSGNLTLSIDNIVMDLYISSGPARDRFMNLIAKQEFTHAVVITHWESARIGSFKEQFSVQFQDGNSFWIGAVLNGRKPEYGRIRLDFNPNKVAGHEVFQTLLKFLVKNTQPMHRIIKRFDLAVDIPVMRQDVFLVKDNRVYIERRHGQEWTQYLGAKSSTVGRVNLYNKQIESHLSAPMTRLELTLDPTTPFEKINFPTVYYLDDLQMSFDETTRATDTERFILNAILQGCGTLDQLGRRTREKIKGLMERYVKYITISARDYVKILHQLDSYKNGKLPEAATDPDQPPPKKADLPDWIWQAMKETTIEEWL